MCPCNVLGVIRNAPENMTCHSETNAYLQNINAGKKIIIQSPLTIFRCRLLYTI